MKRIKKMICLIMACVMLSMLLCPAAVAVKDKDDYDHLPQVYVCGLGSRPVYYKDDPEKTSLFYPVDTDRLLSNLNNLGEYLKQAIRNPGSGIIYNCVYSWLWDCFGMIGLGTDGVTSSDELTTDPCNLDYTGKGKYDFNYDSRLGPVDLAHQLHEYIGWVQEDSGSERIELVGSSMGTAVVMAYLEMYPESMEFIDSVLLCVPSVEGVDFISEIFTGNFNVDPDTFQDFINLVVANEDLDLFLSVLNKSNALDKIIEFALEPFMREALLDALMDILRNVFATLPAAWAVVQPEEFYTALETMFGENYDDPDHEYAVLINKVIYYHENVMKKSEDIFADCMNNGVKMNVVCKYGRPTVPLSKDGNVMSDGLVELEKSSFGATCAMFGQTLPADYTQALYPEYNFLSPDGCVDASTCALPFNTWFIKGLEHGTKNDDYYKLLDAIIYDDLDIYSNPEYPQFLEVSSKDDDLLIPMQETKPEGVTHVLYDLIKLCLRILTVIIKQINKFVK